MSVSPSRFSPQGGRNSQVSGSLSLCSACWRFTSVGFLQGRNVPWRLLPWWFLWDRGLFWVPLCILPLLGKFDEVYEALVHSHPNLTVYKKEEIPERWHYKYNSRIQPIIAVADEGWYILQNKSDNFLCEYVILCLPILHCYLLK